SERQSQDATTGGRRTLIQRLSKDLQREFPGISGFSVSNLWKINNFYEAYATSERLSPLVREIAWSHNLVILDRCHDPLEREFYIRMTRKYGWTRNVLLHQIETKSYERTLMGQTNFKQTLTPEQLSRAKLAVKDEYTFDFLDLGDDYSERELERALIVRVEEFLREMGGMFAFVSSQFRLEVANKEYFIDLLLYHRRLKSLVAVGLKVGEFQPEYVCKMQFYLAVLDDTVREEGENPSIGMILCKQKDRTIVEYALRDARKPIGVATYQTVQQLPKELEGQLPSPEEIAKLLEIE
ncbi:MAG: PDDEXK nuclease domain-containing protein, partial [Pseudomonadota bacterium]